MTAGWAATNTLRRYLDDAYRLDSKAHDALALVGAALDAAARVTALISDDGPPFLFDGAQISNTAELELLSLHDHLNDLRAVREGK